MDNGNDDGAIGGILILGGTGEARALATALVGAGHTVTTSLAGRTAAPHRPQGHVRIGGFGGIDGLAAYLAAHRPRHVVDATHPFAARISANAVAACEQTGTPLVRLERPAWTPGADSTWIDVPDMAHAATVIPSHARVFLTIGRQDLSPFFSRRDCSFLARMIDIPADLPADWTVIAAQGPFSVADEMALMQHHAITHLISKNAGGDQTRAKLDAAARLAIPVVMVARPSLPDAPMVTSIEAVMALL